MSDEMHGKDCKCRMCEYPASVYGREPVTTGEQAASEPVTTGEQAPQPLCDCDRPRQQGHRATCAQAASEPVTTGEQAPREPAGDTSDAGADAPMSPEGDESQGDIEAFTDQYDDDALPYAEACVKSRGDTLGDIKDVGAEQYGWRITIGRREFLVCTDIEADDAWDVAMDSYIDECVLPEMPENLRGYFDTDKWKKDAQMDGRGHALATYDGSEDEEEVDGRTYYIYRVN